MSRLTVGSIEGLTENSNVISVPTGHTLNAVDGLQIGGVAQGVATAFTPSWTNLTVGNGTQTAFYVEVNELLYVVLDLDFGSTSAITGVVSLNNPTGAVLRDVRAPVGQLWNVDITGTNFAGHLRVASTSTLRLYSYQTSGSGITEASVNATNPFTWTTGDQIRLSYTVATS